MAKAKGFWDYVEKRKNPNEFLVSIGMKPRKKYERRVATKRVATKKIAYTDDWRKIRKEKKKKNPFCEECRREEFLTVHHVDENPKNNEDKNLQVLCWECHAKKHEHMRNSPPKSWGKW